MSAPTVELFVCSRYEVKLSRASCADRHRRVSGRGGTRTHDERASSAAKLRFGKCLDCPIGAAHARGETPEVELAAITIAPRLAQEARPRRVPAAPAIVTAIAPPSPRSVSEESRVAPRPRLVLETEPKKEAHMYKDKNCKACGTTFAPATGRQSYCSPACRPSARAAAAEPAEAASTRPSKHRRAGARATSADFSRASAGPILSGARVLLERFGYVVEELETPKGLFLFVEVRS